MLICYINMLLREVLKLPSLFKVGGYNANNGSRIPQSDLNELLEIISAQYFLICEEWISHFREEEIRFYC